MEEQVAKKIEDFFTKFRQAQYQKGEILIRAEEEPTGVFYLKEGMVKEYAISPKGEEVVINIFRPVSFFPMSWAINNTHNKYYYEAVTPLTVLKAPRGEVVTFLKENPDVLFDLMRRVFKGTDGLIARMTYLMTGSAYLRLITEIIIQAKRFGEKKKDESIKLTITEVDLAERSGMTRETVSREIKKLKNKDLIKFGKGEILIEKIKLLEDELDKAA
jgi:CRP-like cAMP-binding protein